jgi:hypothetical protein
VVDGKAPSDRPALKPDCGKRTVRDFRGDEGNVGVVAGPRLRPTRQLGGGAFGSALILWLAARVPLATVGVCVAVLVAAPGLLA